ncbi:MAG: hypothetical protein OXN89_18350 [Bryobacterales bacterium]|nr:hypothetical protein [Bryobacterales bacterium]
MSNRSMRWLLVPALVLGLGCDGGSDEGEGAEEAPDEQAEASAPADPTEMDATAVAARIEAGEDIFLLDVRTPEELQEDGVIAGYTHIPIDELEGRLAEVPADKPIVAY